MENINRPPLNRLERVSWTIDDRFFVKIEACVDKGRQPFEAKELAY